MTASCKLRIPQKASKSNKNQSTEFDIRKNSKNQINDPFTSVNLDCQIIWPQRSSFHKMEPFHIYFNTSPYMHGNFFRHIMRANMGQTSIGEIKLCFSQIPIRVYCF